MSLVVLGAGGVLAVAGSRLAAVAFAASAALAATGHPTAATLAAVWGPAAAAGLVAGGVPPRRVALPAVGLGGVLVAASATNVASVIPAWTVAAASLAASAACTVPRAARTSERAWTLAVLGADLPFMASVCWVAAERGFSSWAARPGAGPAALLVAAAALRVPLAAGARDRFPEAGLVVVRAQVVVLLGWALGGPAALARVVAYAGPAAFALAGMLALDARRDVAQELGLVAAAMGAGALGWHPAGWAWGALAAGTLVHTVRLAGPGSSAWSRFARRSVLAGGLGSPFVPVVVASVAAAVSGGGRVAAWTSVLLLAGLASRPWGPERARATALPPGGAPALAAAVSLAVWAPLAWSGPASAARPAPWPPAWGVAVLAGGALAGGCCSRWLAPARPRSTAEGSLPRALARAGTGRLDAFGSRRGTLVVALALLAGLAVALWILGAVRGFL